MFFCVFFFQLELESMQKVNIAFHKWEIKSTLEYSLQKFRWSICFSTHSLASLDGLQCPKIQSSAAASCGATAQTKFPWPLSDKWDVFIYLY